MLRISDFRLLLFDNYGLKHIFLLTKITKHYVYVQIKGSQRVN